MLAGLPCPNSRFQGVVAVAVAVDVAVDVEADSRLA
jgi:hypothetical protein